MIGGRLIKVCGLRAADNVRAVAALPGVDLVGFIFHPASPRCVTDVPDVPLPDAIRWRREPFRIEGFVRSSGVME